VWPLQAAFIDWLPARGFRYGPELPSNSNDRGRRYVCSPPRSRTPQTKHLSATLPTDHTPALIT